MARVRPVDFVLAIALGRGIRYFGEGFLALWYGERAATFLRDNAREIGLILAAVALTVGVAWILWQRRRATPGEA